jgi:hypothetical protein
LTINKSEGHHWNWPSPATVWLWKSPTDPVKVIFSKHPLMAGIPSGHFNIAMENHHWSDVVGKWSVKICKGPMASIAMLNSRKKSLQIWIEIQ